MWIATPRRQYSRNRLGHETNVTDAERALIEPFLRGEAPPGMFDQPVE